MLRFYGIRFNQHGAPERFSISIALSESLHTALEICDQLNGDLEKAIKAIEARIERMFSGLESTASNKQYRYTIAKWFRAKDMIQFMLKHQETKELKLEIAKELNSREDIAEKWNRIESIILEFVTSLCSITRDEQLMNTESDLNLTLQMVSLFFLEQDEEVPPANLELQFIRYQFPKIIWKKRDGFNASSNPFWQPKNVYCRSSYLVARIISRLYENPSSETKKQLTTVQSEVAANSKSSVSYNSLLPQEEPDEISLILDDLEQENEQLSLIPESASETLFSLQKLIQKKFSHAGVKHFLGILRQLAESDESGFCSFKLRKHLELVSKPSKQGDFSEKQISLFYSVFDLLTKIQVKRTWKLADETKQITNPFILELYQKCSPGQDCMSKRKLVLDPIFLPGQNNPFRLGIHLRLIPERLFRESAYKHPLLTSMASYITGTWLNEYMTGKGTTSKTSREIIEGCAFNLTPANRYKIVDKVKSELAYMNEKCYISDYSCHKNQEGNPWDDLHNMVAPENVLAEIAEKMQIVSTSSTSEKLIA